ncbi:hypothetical protein R3P38DRAFT_3354080 [Favolaschia claudopus]|uniref:Coenzyme Q-binding protein COQ10 START domain-containing protein n=1 Tax=Favolaschia claudopus TaxID=2862362 RepID=A0AAW0BNB4_9AGAR
MSSSSTNLTVPRESEWPTYFSKSVIIKAPRQFVWDVLVDFDSYPKWNPYIRESTLIDATKKPLPGHQIALGHQVALKVHMPPTMDDTVKMSAMTETVKQVQKPSELAWGSHRLPGWLFGAQHWNVLTEVEGGTKFEIVTVFSGFVTSMMLSMLSMRQPFIESVDTMAEAMKKRCEELAANSN